MQNVKAPAISRSAKLEAYQLEVRKGRIIKSIIMVVVLFCSALLYMVVAGPQYDPILSYVGLRSITNREGGVYADCSDPDNRDVAYCRPRQSNADKTWNELDKNRGAPLPFTLYSRGG